MSQVRNSPLGEPKAIMGVMVKEMTEKIDWSKLLLTAFVMLLGFLVVATASFLVDVFGIATLAFLWLLAAGLGGSGLLLYQRKRKTEMYSDIAEGLAPHNWWPGQVSASHPGYDEWDANRKRFISYKNSVQLDMRAD